MRLDVFVLTHVQEADVEGTYKIHNVEPFKERCTTFQGYCIGECVMEFPVGSYRAYSEYRQSLAGLIGVTAEEVWDDSENYQTEDFFEQIEFPDCEGTFDYIVAGRLYSAYERNNLHAMMALDKCSYDLYCRFKKAFKLAAEGKGIVAYH